MEDEKDVGSIIRGWIQFLRANIRWITRPLLLVVLGLPFIHRLVPEFLDWLSSFFGLPKPSLAAILGLALFVFLSERIIVVEETLRRPPFDVYRNRVIAYTHLSELVQSRGASTVDLLQVSGYTALRFLRDLADRCPKVEVRLLLMDPAVANNFDSDKQPDHAERISATIREIGVIEEDFKARGFKVSLLHYRTPPSVSAIVIDDRIACVSWYHCFTDPANQGVTRLRGHLSPTITAVDQAAEPLLSFVKKHFEMVWEAAERSGLATRNAASTVPSTN